MAADVDVGGEDALRRGGILVRDVAFTGVLMGAVDVDVTDVLRDAATSSCYIATSAYRTTHE